MCPYSKYRRWYKTALKGCFTAVMQVFTKRCLFVLSEFIAFSAVVDSTVKSRCQRAKNFAGTIMFLLSRVRKRT